MEKVIIGKIVNTHGIRGELKVKSMTDFPEERFDKGAIVTLHYQNQDINMEVLRHRYHKGHILVTFKGYEDINLVEKYKGCELYCDKDDSLLDDGEYYVDDLIGCQVYNYDCYIGDVVEVQLYDHHDILVVQGEQKVMIPYVDAFVKNEDIDHKRIDVELIEGFIDED
ncbi:MAG: ribosome maturation factor RimM [Erysipelotrichaceae bacterium]|nr:ribosome maturation factor RimM [Erysipelotrichaceae bacterium]